MIVVIFRSKVRPDADLGAMETMSARMSELASAMPGFVAYKDFTAGDGEYLTFVKFVDEPSLLAWRNHPEHVAGQEAGRRSFFTEYDIEVCRVTRAYGFDRVAGRVERHATD